MQDNKKRGSKMYYISDTEYIVFPLHISNKIYYHFNRNYSKNQLINPSLVEKSEVNIKNE